MTISILGIETSNAVCSVCLMTDGEVVAIRANSETNKSVELINGYIEEVLKESNLSLSDLNAVAISGGPGSFTGLRIAASTAKGLCFGLNIPLIHISSLQLMAYGARNRYSSNNFNHYLSLIDARKNNFYSALYDVELNEKGQDSFVALDSDEFKTLIAHPQTLIVINAKLNLPDCPAEIIQDFEFSSADMPELAFKIFNDNKFEDLRYYEPFYLRKFFN